MNQPIVTINSPWSREDVAFWMQIGNRRNWQITDYSAREARRSRGGVTVRFDWAWHVPTYYGNTMTSSSTVHSKKRRAETVRGAIQSIFSRWQNKLKDAGPELQARVLAEVDFMTLEDQVYRDLGVAP